MIRQKEGITNGNNDPTSSNINHYENSFPLRSVTTIPSPNLLFVLHSGKEFVQKFPSWLRCRRSLWRAAIARCQFFFLIRENGKFTLSNNYPPPPRFFEYRKYHLHKISAPTVDIINEWVRWFVKINDFSMSSKER